MKKCSKTSSNRGRAPMQSRAAFTLVEMLISVALVLLMMVMFAQIFQLAGGSIGTMRGIAENDQRARTMQTVLKADLDKRTFRWVFPFAANESTGAAGANMANRQGYFYISENNPNNDLDDVIQFTVMSTITIRNTDITPYYGQAATLAPFTFPNQPDADDAQLVPNNTGLSSVAEIAYFVRNGNLYRRQLLIREPLAIISQLGVSAGQPTDGTDQIPSVNNPFNPNPYPNPILGYQYLPLGHFWNDFDYSAFLTYSSGSSLYTGAQFVGYTSLDNSTPSGPTVQWPVNAIASPAQRFGFSPANIPGVIAGRPKEFRLNMGSDSGTANIADFLGRFTLQECSDPGFIYPQNLSGAGNVPVDPNAQWTLDPTDGYVTAFPSGPRRGEDLILANVHAFDIQLWDSAQQAFVNMGDPALTGNGYDYQIGNRYKYGLGAPLSPTYGPRLNEFGSDAVNAVFDTWHPQIDFDTTNDPSPAVHALTGQTIYDEPPFRPLYHLPASVSIAGDTSGWQPNQPYAVGNLVFPSGPPTVAQPSPPFPAGAVGQLPYGYPFYYRCVATKGAGPTAGHSGITEPSWPQVAGITVVDNNAIWQAVDNRKPLQAIQIQIRYLDTSSQQMRQLTIVQSLVDSN